MSLSKYTVHGLDVWGNDEDSYDVNDVYPSRGVIELADDAPYSAVIDALIAADFIDEPGANTWQRDKLEIIGEEDMYIDYDGKPCLELRKVNL